MKNKLLTTLLAAALCVPQVAFAARDGEGMEYTSAAEGFYGSIRTQFTSKASADKGNGAQFTGGGSRLGVRGSLDLGSGLTGLYRYEWSISDENGKPIGNTRLHYVGLSGSWGEIQAGSHWEQDYNWVTAGTDIASTGSGNFAPHFRRKNSFQYTSPNIDGFQAALRFTMDGANKDTGQKDTFSGLIAPNVAIGAKSIVSSPSENVDEWALAARYSTHGFTFGGAYEVQPEGRPSLNVTGSEPSTRSGGATNAMPHNVVIGEAVMDSDNVNNGTHGNAEDATFWALRLGYSQDNWSVNSWYGEHNTSEVKLGGTGLNPGIVYNPQDTKIFSLSGNMDLGKYAIVGIFEQRDNQAAQEDSVFVFNVDYKFTSRSKAYLAYIANDFDSNDAKEDEIRIGLRADF